MNFRTTTLLLLGLCLCPGCATVGRNISGVENFDTVDPGVYRGAQPTRDGLRTLKREYRVATVLNLRQGDPAWEPDAAKQDGVAYFNVPSSASAVEPEKVREVLGILRSAPRPIFVHCHAGRDRTGLAVAVYRIVDEHWTREAAIQELYAHGHNRLFLWEITHFLRTFNPDDFAAGDHSSGASRTPGLTADRSGGA